MFHIVIYIRANIGFYSIYTKLNRVNFGLFVSFYAEVWE